MRTELLREQRANIPFCCPPDLQERIKTFETLKAFADGRRVQGFQEFSSQCKEARLLVEQLRPYISRLADDKRRGLEAAAREYADARAFSDTPNWHLKQAEYITTHAGDWKRVRGGIQTALQEAYTERRGMEGRHDEALVKDVDDLFELPSAVVEARTLIAEVSVARKREAAAIEAVQRVWQGAKKVNDWANRSPVEPDENDRALARNWANSYGDGSYYIGAMESARCAELVALALYRELLGPTEDLSILQFLSPSDSRWHTADIAAGGRLIDVKNARRSFSSRNAYSEHTVKRFKKDRISGDVVISGFLSEYLVDRRSSQAEHVVWLGETTLGMVERLRRDFESDYLTIDLSRDRLTLIPPWLFEYPPECYAERDTAIRAVRSDKFVLPKSDCPLGLLLLAGRLASGPPQDTLWEEAVTLGQRLAASAALTRPVLFLHILDRFCHTARNGVPFPARAIRQLLFPADSRALSRCSDDTTPLAACDPLGVVETLLDVLERVAETCAQLAVTFTSFRLDRPSIFQGRKHHGGWQTLFAYCGGWRRLRTGGPVKCGQSPLYLGQNKSCDRCRKLICHQCGFCEESCPACPPRQAEWHTAVATDESGSQVVGRGE
jgi:hypothetical protein